MPQRSGARLRIECNSQAGSTPVVDKLESRDGGRHADSKSVAAKRLQVRFLLLSYPKPRGAMVSTPLSHGGDSRSIRLEAINQAGIAEGSDPCVVFTERVFESLLCLAGIRDGGRQVD